MKTNEKKKEILRKYLLLPLCVLITFCQVVLVVFAGGGNRQDYWKQNSRRELWLSE